MTAEVVASQAQAQTQDQALKDSQGKEADLTAEVKVLKAQGGAAFVP